MQIECLDGFHDPLGQVGRPVPNIAADQLPEMNLQILRRESGQLRIGKRAGIHGHGMSPELSID
jgi:hypothetical protein